MATQPLFRYAERRPRPELIAWIRNYWMFHVGPGAAAVHHVPPDGCTALVMNLTPRLPPGPSMLSGPWLAPLMVPVNAGDCFAGVRFQPGAVGPLLAIDPTRLRDRAQPALQLVGEQMQPLETAAAGVTTIEQLVDSLDPVLDRLTRAATLPDALVMAAVQRITDTYGELQVTALATELGVSDRTLRRRFSAATGISPKQYARIRRLLAAAWKAAEGTESWSSVAYGVGYADQPHLNRDVTDLTGLTPSALRQRIRSTEHDDVVP